MPWMFVAAAAISAYSANQAGKAGKEGAQLGVDAQERAQQQMRSDLGPWAQAGQTSLDKLMFGLGLGPKDAEAVGPRPVQADYMTNQMISGPSTPSYIPYGGTQPGQPASFQNVLDQGGWESAMKQYEQRVAADQAAAGGGYGELMEPFDQDKFKESPGYQFNLEQGLEAIRKGAAGQYGNVIQPTTLRDLGTYAQGTASNEWNTERNAYDSERARQYGMLMGQSESGRGAATQTGLAGVQTGAGVAESLSQGANARMAGIIGVGNAGQDAYNNYLQQSIINSQQPTYTTNNRGQTYDPNFQPGGGTGLRY